MILKGSLNFEKFGISIFLEIQNKSGGYNVSFNKFNVLNIKHTTCLCGDLRETLKDLILNLFLLERSRFSYLTKVRKNCVYFDHLRMFYRKFTNDQATFSTAGGSEPKLYMSTTGLFLEISTALSREQIQ